MNPRSLSPVAAVNVDVERHPVQRRADRVGHHRRGLGEHLALPPHAFGEARGVGVLREAHRGLRARRLVGGAVDRLGDPNLVDALAGSAEHHADHVRHPRMRAAAENRRIAVLASLPDTIQILRRLLAAGDPGGAASRRSHRPPAVESARRCWATAGCSSRRRASSAISASMSLVAVTPVGSGQPASSAASTPTLSAPCA